MTCWWAFQESYESNLQWARWKDSRGMKREFWKQFEWLTESHSGMPMGSRGQPWCICILCGPQYEQDGRVLYMSRNEPPEIVKASWIVSSALTQSVMYVANRSNTAFTINLPPVKDDPSSCWTCLQVDLQRSSCTMGHPGSWSEDVISWLKSTWNVGLTEHNRGIYPSGKGALSLWNEQHLRLHACNAIKCGRNNSREVQWTV